MTLTPKFLSGSATLLLALFVACGGGGGGSTPPPGPVAPTISVQPANQSVMAGATATFSVTAAGTAPLSYQWLKGGTAISLNGTTASYTTPATVIGDNGSSFTVTVTNSAGNITSTAATLTVQALGTGLAYTDPTTGTYQLKKNATLSTASHLVLDLVGPSSGTGAGVTLTLSADTTKVTWVDVPAGGTTAVLMQNGTQFSLGTGIPIQKARATGNVLQATVAQKNPTAAVPLNGALIRVALDLKPGLGLAQGTTITLSADAVKSQVLDGTGAITPVTVSVGTLTAQ
jgi:hypothetical protein